ncbi:MAG: esterase, partial [Betaproteobacteria bacterium]
IRMTAAGSPVYNTGVAVVPATLIDTIRQTDAASALASSGVLALSVRSGKLIEARWFPDDGSVEDAYFGGEPQQDGPSPAERAFE